MKWLEPLGIAAVVLAVFGTAAGIFAYEQTLESGRECITIRMRTYEHGNPKPETVRLKKGEPACLRLTSDDTTHGVNIPDFDINSEAIHPGKWTYLRFTPEKSGTFSFVCNTVCSPMHSRVRGKLNIEE
jgi:cytochrome c oxidase subunit 2